MLLILAGAGGGVFYMASSGKEHSGDSQRAKTVEGGSEGDKEGTLPRVEVARPKRGGMERTTNQPGTINAFEFARLYAKVSGYLEKLNVDRGSRVKKDDLLAEIYVPELKAAVDQADASVKRTEAAVVQAEARVTSAEKTIEARLAEEQKAVADLETAIAALQYREKQLQRISDLVDRNAVERRLLDEERDRYDAALATKHSGVAGVAAAKAEVAEAQALLAQAHADLLGAKAEVMVSKAILEKEKALFSYTKILSPYDGVIIYRGESVHPGSFIQAAAQDLSTNDPLLTVAVDDKMRTIIPIPDRDVPHCDPGDPAIIRIDAMNGREFRGVVSRMAESENINDRTMRIEVDLANPNHVLRDGMFGRGEIILERDTTNLTIPSSCLVDRDSAGQGAVQVIRDSKIYKRKVQIGRDDGLRAEIISGLELSADVVLQPDGSMADGAQVQVEAAIADTASKSGEAAEVDKSGEPAPAAKSGGTAPAAKTSEH